jgi:hypothetical protein
VRVFFTIVVFVVVWLIVFFVGMELLGGWS